jgi:hypothetical protein
VLQPTMTIDVARARAQMKATRARIAELNAAIAKTTTYYATLQSCDGNRTEHTTYGWLAGQIAVGDIGVAHVKGDRLIEFVRLDTEHARTA